jgi:hypothetical protein
MNMRKWPYTSEGHASSQGILHQRPYNTLQALLITPSMLVALGRGKRSHWRRRRRRGSRRHQAQRPRAREHSMQANRATEYRTKDPLDKHNPQNTENT